MRAPEAAALQPQRPTHVQVMETHAFRVQRSAQVTTVPWEEEPVLPESAVRGYPEPEPAQTGQKCHAVRPVSKEQKLVTTAFGEVVLQVMETGQHAIPPGVTLVRMVIIVLMVRVRGTLLIHQHV